MDTAGQTIACASDAAAKPKQFLCEDQAVLFVIELITSVCQTNLPKAVAL